jgi:hypothetical protein
MVVGWSPSSASSKLDFVDAGHFAYEDRADEYTAQILDWWNCGCQQV